MNYIVSSIFTTCLDPQRNIKWNPTTEILQNWYVSGRELCKDNEDISIIVFYDQLSQEIIDTYSEKYINFIQVDDCNYLSPYDYRWIVYKNFVDNNLEEFDNIFFIDITDVIISTNPFPHIKPLILYSGDEEIPWDNGWSNARSYFHKNNIIDFTQIYQNNKDKNLLNCGILGGSYNIISDFLSKIYYYIELTLEKPYDTTDMVTHNYVIRKYFPNVVHGSPVNSVFKKYQLDRKDVWFIHK